MSAGFPPVPRLIAQQVRYQLLTFVRSPVGMFFTLALPLLMLTTIVLLSLVVG